MKKIVIIVVASIIVPYIVTLLCVHKTDSIDKKYQIKESGKIIECNGENIDMEKFIPLVLAARLDIESEEEVLKVQAVIIRTQIAQKFEKNKKDTITVKDLGLKYIPYQELEKKWKDDFSENYNYLNKIICNTSMEMLNWNPRFQFAKLTSGSAYLLQD